MSGRGKGSGGAEVKWGGGGHMQERRRVRGRGLRKGLDGGAGGSQITTGIKNLANTLSLQTVSGNVSERARNTNKK